MTARCRACGRRLLDPASRAAGYGPVCRARLAPAPAVVTVPAGEPGHVDGQTALALTYHQPTLASL